MLMKKAPLFFFFFWLTFSSAAPLPNDPRCQAHSYLCPHQAGAYDPTWNVDSTTCADGTNCPKCLNSGIWPQRLADLGLDKAPRTQKLHTHFSNWLSGEIMQTIWQMLLTEAMGYYDAEAYQLPSNPWEIICCPQTIFQIEYWRGVEPEDEGYFTQSLSPIGYDGQSALFVPEHTLQAHPLANAWQAYRYLENYKHIFPPSFSTPCEDIKKDSSLPCSAANTKCARDYDSSQWTNTTCTNGRYVPPQCVGNPDCQEIFLASTGWDSGFFEGLIKNLGLNFTIVYLGAKTSELPAYIAAKGQNKSSHFMFYWYEPDPLIAAVGGSAVNFPPRHAGCGLKEKEDPTLNTAKCAYPKIALSKFGRRDDIRSDKDLKFFYDSFFFESGQINSLMKKHLVAGGNQSVWNISCDWIQANFGIWSNWLRHTAPASSDTTASRKMSTGVLATVIIIPLVVVGAAIAGFLFLNARAAAVTKNAPTKPPLALIFTDVESSTNLWEMYGSLMGKAMEIHHDVIRECIAEQNCYEVKTIGDSFMIACPTTLDAVMLSFQIQSRLFDAPNWPEEIKYVDTVAMKKGGAGGRIPSPNHNNNQEDGQEDHSSPTDASSPAVDINAGLFQGLRVRIGVHCCTEVTPQLDRIHGRYDYYGHDVNVSARVESMAQGGQILMTEQTLKVLQADGDFELLLGEEEASIQRYRKGAELKGVSEAVDLYSVMPLRFEGRKFEGAERGEDEELGKRKAESDYFGDNADVESQSQMSSAVGGQATVQSTTRALLTNIFGALSTFPEKKELLDKLWKYNKLSSASSGEKRENFTRKLRMLEKQLVNCPDPNLIGGLTHLKSTLGARKPSRHGSRFSLAEKRSQQSVEKISKGEEGVHNDEEVPGQVPES